VAVFESLTATFSTEFGYSEAVKFVSESHSNDEHDVEINRFSVDHLYETDFFRIFFEKR